MIKTKVLFAAAILSVGFTACKTENKEAKENAEMLNSYVDSVEGATPVYTAANWTAIDNGYQERAMRAEKNLAELSAEEKAKAETSKAKYEALKAKYELAIKEQEAKVAIANANANANANGVSNFRKVLRDRLFGEGKIGDDMKFAFVNAGNILSVYRNFVNVVDDNKGNYTREDWDEINVLYEALDTRKNTVEKEGLRGADNLKIAGLKIRYAAINATHRGGTKVKENADAKQ